MYRWNDAARTTILRLSDGAHIPADPANVDFAAIEGEIGDFVDDLDARRTEALASVTAAVATRRGAFSAEQGVIYDAKLSEAQHYDAAGRPDDVSPYVLLAASAEGSGRTVSDEADAVLARGAQWLRLAAETERLRLSASRAIAAADTAEDIEAARSAHVAQLADL